MRSIGRCALALLLTSVVSLAAVAPAFANSPWWHLSSSTRPTYLRAGVAKDEVQKLTVEGNEGIYILRSSNSHIAVLRAGETPEGVQQALEEELGYGTGTVRVTGAPGPGGNGPYEVYEITFVGKLADQPVEPALVASNNVKRLVGGKEVPGSVTLEETSTGRPDGEVVVTAVNLGDARADPAVAPITLADNLPKWLTPVAIEAFADEQIGTSYEYPLECSLESVSCTFTGKSSKGATSIPPYEQIQMRILVNVKKNTSTAKNAATVTGGGAPASSVEQSLAVSGAPVPYGVSAYEVRPEEAGGGVDTQAGSHPFQLTTTLALNETLEGRAEVGHLSGGSPAGITKDLHFNLPPGLIGNPTPFAQCSLSDFLHASNVMNSKENRCLPQTVVGVARVIVNVPKLSGLNSSTTPIVVPLFNITPALGEPARFGFFTHGVPVLLNTAVRTGGDYGVTVNVTNITQEAEFLGSEVTFWGVPGDPRHDNSRNWECLLHESALATANEKERERLLAGGAPTCPPFEASKPPPLLSLPPSCTGALHSNIEADSWSEPNAIGRWENTAPMPAMDGCNDLQFAPSIELVPDGQAGSTPTGLAVNVHVPQETVLNAGGLAAADVKDTTVTLPAGVVLNPAGADGLLACSKAQVALDSIAATACPDASKVGLVKIKTPLLPNELEGTVYLAEQEANPFGSLIALYVVVEDPVSGTHVKLAGEVKPDPVTGQLVSTFKNTPELPFETFELHFFGGDRAPLATPALCGEYTTTASIEPSTLTGPVQSSSTFEVISGPNGKPCASPLAFAPALTAGTTSIQAGGFSPFTMTMSREDGNQNLQAIDLHMPPGLSGLLAGVELCREPLADEGLCGPNSLIGETTVSVGLGGDPFSVKGGRVYITGPYEGAPFGLSIVNPAKAGPFDLEKNTPCDCVVVRAKIEVDPITAQLTVTSDNEGPYRIPTILDGIPLQIKHVNVTINRPGFTFNPTDCQPMNIAGTLHSTEGATHYLSVPFQVTNCATLAFKPGFAVSTSGKTSRRIGASLHVKLTYPKAPFGSQANIKSVKVDLPRQLPSNLKTLQQACPHQTFEANPSACSAGSRVGFAKAITPLIPVPLEGPAYFVSYGGLKFPELVIVLQGYGVTLHLHGETFINERTGITSSTFHTVPDAPVGSFELTLPQGPSSALAANTKLCAVKGGLRMPTLFTAQNGAVVKQDTPIQTTGCPKAAKKHRAKKAPHQKKR